MTEVWLVYRDWGYEGKEVVGVYGSEDKAKSAEDLLTKVTGSAFIIEKQDVK